MNVLGINCDTKVVRYLQSNIYELSFNELGLIKDNTWNDGGVTCFILRDRSKFSFEPGVKHQRKNTKTMAQYCMV